MKNQRRIRPRRAISYTLGLGSVGLSIIAGSQLALGLLAGLYCLRRLRAFRSLMS